MVELVLTLVLLAGAFVVRRTGTHREAGWRGGLLFDGWARRVLRARTHGGRRRVARASDVLFWSLLFYPGFVDGLAVAGLLAGDWARAAGVFVADLEAFTAMALFLFGLQRYVARERPYATFPDEGVYAPVYPERFRSFFSGHAAASFTGAALVWHHHAHVPGFGEPWHLGVAVAALVAATATALLRVVADRHWSSDVVAGALLGACSGWVVPAVLHA